jgi:hypothetical protein
MESTSSYAGVVTQRKSSEFAAEGLVQLFPSPDHEEIAKGFQKP